MDNFFGLEYRKDNRYCPETSSSTEHAIAPVKQKCVTEHTLSQNQR